MAIRLRNVEGYGIVALCAARSIPHPADIYLDDAAHMALARKFSDDWRPNGFDVPYSQDIGRDEVVTRLESNNTNRTAWDKAFGHDQPL